LNTETSKTVNLWGFALSGESIFERSIFHGLQFVRGDNTN